MMGAVLFPSLYKSFTQLPATTYGCGYSIKMHILHCHLVSFIIYNNGSWWYIDHRPIQIIVMGNDVSSYKSQKQTCIECAYKLVGIYHKQEHKNHMDAMVAPPLTPNHQFEGFAIMISTLGLLAQNRINGDFRPPHPRILVAVSVVIVTYFPPEVPYATYPSTICVFPDMGCNNWVNTVA